MAKGGKKKGKTGKKKHTTGEKNGANGKKNGTNREGENGSRAVASPATPVAAVPSKPKMSFSVLMGILTFGIGVVLVASGLDRTPGARAFGWAVVFGGGGRMLTTWRELNRPLQWGTWIVVGLASVAGWWFIKAPEDPAVRVKFSSTQTIDVSPDPGESNFELNIDNVVWLAQVGAAELNEVSLTIRTSPQVRLDNPRAKNPFVEVRDFAAFIGGPTKTFRLTADPEDAHGELRAKALGRVYDVNLIEIRDRRVLPRRIPHYAYTFRIQER